MITLDDVRKAAGVIRGKTVRTPLAAGTGLTAPGGGDILLKLENLQVTGAFKIRGVLNKVASLTAAERSAGIICSTSGSHGIAVAQVAKREGLRAVVVVPESTPEYKVRRIERYAPVEIRGASYDDATRHAMRRAADEHSTYIPSFDDPRIIAGQGTVALEILEDAGPVDVIVVPIGGGGLAAGTIVATRGLQPGVRIVGVEAAGAPSMAESRDRGAIVELPGITTAAESIAVRKPGRLTFEIIERGIDDIVLVSDEEMKDAVRLLFHEVKVVAELGGAASLAAVVTGRVKASGRVACVVSGGNVSGDRFAEIVRQ